VTGPERPRRRRARWFVAVAVAVVVLGTTSVVVLTRVAEGTSAPAAAPSQVETAEVTKTDLSDAEEADGTLGYGAETSVTGRKPGTLTSLPAAGSTISQGKTVYSVDAKPVPLFYGTLPFYRDLADGVDKGPDVKELEQNLQALGFGGFGAPDTKFTSATAAAVKKWQKSLGVEQTGTFAPGDVVLSAGEIRVSSVTGQLGGPGDGEVLKTTGTGRSVTVKLDAAKQALAQVGAKVGLTVNGTETTGTITEVGNTAEQGKDASGQPNGTLTITVTVNLDDPKAAGSLESSPVTVRFTKDVHKGVLAVPVGALLALAEGGYAVEVDDHGKRHLVAVKTGMFSGSKVEVSGAGLAPGVRVVTTS
jgi:peptidoglycan hydrolase-like protein with peptidoglycan-binding domain